MPWTKNGESAAASWNGTRYRDASAPPPAVNVPRKYFALRLSSRFPFRFFLASRGGRERCHIMFSFKATVSSNADIICVSRTEAFILGEGEKKIEEKADTRMY